MTAPENPITELADGLRTAFADVAARTPVLAPLFALILASLDSLLRRLESLFATWQAGALPAPQAPSPRARRSTATAAPHLSSAGTRRPAARRRSAPSRPESAQPAAAHASAARTVSRLPARPHRARHHTHLPSRPATLPTPNFNFRPPGPSANPRLNRSG